MWKWNGYLNLGLIICLTLTVCRYPSRKIVNPPLLWKRFLLLKKQNRNISELPATQLNIHGAWYGRSGPDMVGWGLAGAWYGGCNMVWNVPTLVDDIFSLWTTNRDRIEHSIEQANNHHPTIKFTAEISDKETTFLDTYIYKGERFERDAKSLWSFKPFFVAK